MKCINQYTKGAVIITILALMIALAISKTGESQIAAAVKLHLDRNGDVILASAINQREWSLVCVHPSMSTGGKLTTGHLQRKFSVSELKLPLGLMSASDSHWVLMFFTHPQTLEMHSISNDELFLFGVTSRDKSEEFPMCRGREEAVFQKTSSITDPSFQGIVLTTLEELGD